MVPDFSSVRPIVAVPGCPAGPNGIMRTLALLALAALNIIPPSALQRSKFLDEYGRPPSSYSSTLRMSSARGLPGTRLVILGRIPVIMTLSAYSRLVARAPPWAIARGIR